MPFYEYECSACKFYVEALQKLADAPMKKCPSCGKETLQRLISAPVFRLKGSGWYETDFKSDQENKRNLAEGAEADKEPAAVTESDDKQPTVPKRKATRKLAGKAASKPAADKLAKKPARKIAKKAVKKAVKKVTKPTGAKKSAAKNVKSIARKKPAAKRASQAKSARKQPARKKPTVAKKPARKK